MRNIRDTDEYKSDQIIHDLIRLRDCVNELADTLERGVSKAVMEDVGKRPEMESIIKATERLDAIANILEG